MEPYIFFEVKNLIFCHFSTVWKFNSPCDSIKSKLGQKEIKVVYYIPTVIKRSNLITMVFSRIVIHFSDQFFKIVMWWPIHNPSVWRHSKIGSKEAQICTSSTVGEKRSKPTGNVCVANFKIFKIFFPVITSLTQYWVKKDLSLYIMYQQWYKDQNQ